MEYFFNSDRKMRSSGTNLYAQVLENTEECSTPAGELGSCRSLTSCVQEEFMDDYETFLKYFCSIGR